MSTIHRFCGTADCFDWENVKSYHYDSEAAVGVTGRIILGSADGAQNFVFRYFRVDPGGHSTLDDLHAHDHGVIILHGRALVSLGEEQFELGPNDAIYISPWERHSLMALGTEPMGFLCVIPHKDLLAKIEAINKAGEK